MVIILSGIYAKVLVIFIVAGIAFCLAGVFASMTGTYHLDFGNNTTNESSILGNINTGSSNSHDSSSSSSSSQQSNSYQSTSQSHSSQDSGVVTVEDNSEHSESNPSPESHGSPVEEPGPS